MSIESITPTNFSGLFIITNEIFRDNRGVFIQNFQKEDFDEKLSKYTDKKYEFVQDNISVSADNVVRGLHYQLKKPQAKLVSVLNGSIIDVVVDIRKDSKTFGKYFIYQLYAGSAEQILIPEGFAHGFRSLYDNTIVSYKTTNPYCNGDEYGIIYNDPHLNIDWTLSDTYPMCDGDKFIVSPKDLSYNELIFTEPSKLF